MKYNEAIDMILDGGRARRPDWLERDWIIFSGDGLKWERCKTVFMLIAPSVKQTDWIVEKDGVVYEESPIGKMHIIKGRIPKDFAEEIARRRIEDKNIADEVNEDWLEKKMRCFYRKNTFINPMNNTHYSPLIKQSTCRHRECPFCFSQEQPKPDHIPEVINMVYCNNHKDKEAVISFCKECFQEKQYEQKRHKELSEQPREKVLFNEVYKDVASMVGSIKNIWYWHGKNGKGDPVEEAKPLWDELKQKLEYLVSLQEK